MALAWSVLTHGSMKKTYDTAGLPFLHLDGIAVPAVPGEPVRVKLHALQRARLDAGRWAEADLLGWLIDDLDRLPAPWPGVMRALLGDLATGVGTPAAPAA